MPALPSPPFDDAPAARRRNWYWTCQLLGWASVVLFNLSFVAMAQPGARIVAVCCTGGIAGLALSDGWHRLLKRRRAAQRPLPAYAIAVAIVLLAMVQSILMWLAFYAFQPFGAPHGFGWLPNAMMFWVGTYLAWTIFYMAVLAMRRARDAEARALRLQLHAKDAELRALQAQVNPHFFFNSLNSVRALIYEDRDAAAQMIDRLADLMRYALQAGQVDTVPLAVELEVVRSYLAIEKIRFEERLRVYIAIEPGLEGVAIPPMSLQTLVENAVKYGVEMQAAGSDIHVRAWRDADATVIEIANSGSLAVAPNATRIGLANARKRLALAVGDDARLDLADADGWVRATLNLPRSVAAVTAVAA